MPLNGSANMLKAELAGGQVQVGFWSSLCSPLVVELIAGAGFDWLLIDSEHAPNDLPEVIAQLQAAAAYPTEAVVRVPTADPVIIKRYLDAGARSLLVPFIEDAPAARAVVAATRYPPQGIRGVSVGHRANRFGRVRGYMHEAPASLCLVVQLETRKSLLEVKAIASVEGVDAVFIGPSDLAGDFGHLGQPGHPEVQDGIRRAIEHCRAIGRPIGILAPVVEDARRYLAWGATMVAVGSDIGVLVRGTDMLAETFTASKEAIA